MIYRCCLYVTDHPGQPDRYVPISRCSGYPSLPLKALASGSAFAMFDLHSREASVVADYSQSVANLIRLIDCTRMKHSRMFMRDLLTYLRTEHGRFRYSVLTLEGAGSERAARADVCESLVAEFLRIDRNWCTTLVDRNRAELGAELSEWARGLPVRVAAGNGAFRNRQHRRDAERD